MEPNNIAQPMTRQMPSMSSKTTLIYLVIAVLVVLGGVLTGWKVSGGGNPGVFGTSTKQDSAAPGAQSAANEAGISDESTFKDSAEGTLENGGLSGEGTHHLVRGEDESKYVALTSTVIDLDSYVGKKVMIWGQSLSSQKATWLMDVGKLRVTE